MQQYDIVTKVLMDRAAASMIEKFLGIPTAEVELIEELPQESVSLKRSDYILRVVGKDGKTRIILWEFLSQWKRKTVLNLFEYSLRALNKFELPVVPVMLLMKHAAQAVDHFEECGMSFRFHLVQLAEMSAAEFMQGSDIHLLPFVGMMQGYEQAVIEADKTIYESTLLPEEKAELLNALAIFTGLQNRSLTRKLVERRRDIMIESYAYELIKHEGFEEGMQQGQLVSARKAVVDVLKARFHVAPLAILEPLKTIESVEGLEELLTQAVLVRDLKAFKTVLKKMVEPLD